jgi:pilus assembly protein CpaE
MGQNKAGPARTPSDPDAAPKLDFRGSSDYDPDLDDPDLDLDLGLEELAPGPSSAPVSAAAIAPAPASLPRASEAAETGDWTLKPGGEARSVAIISDAAGAADTPVPRISIHAYCERGETAEAVRSASADRRLVKASVAVDTGGADVAIAQLARQASPNLLILELSGPPSKVLADLDRLADSVDAGSKAIVIGDVNDIALYRELMRRGVSDYLIAPVQPLQLIRSITGLYADPDKPFVGRVAAVIGAKGGVGSSTVAHNLVWLLAERFAIGSTLIDLDLAFGTAALNFEEDADTGVADALARIDQIDGVYLDRLLVRRSEHLALLPSTASLLADIEATPEAVDALIAIVRRASPFIVLDLPHLWSPWVKRCLVGADEVLIVATPDLAGLRNAKGLADILRTARPHDAPPALVLNMVGVARRPEIPVRDFAKAMGVEPVAVLPFEPAAFGAAANNGEMLAISAPESRAAMGLEALARAICGREPAPRRKNSLLSRLPLLKR